VVISDECETDCVKTLTEMIARTERGRRRAPALAGSISATASALAVPIENSNSAILMMQSAKTRPPRLCLIDLRGEGHVSD
jgi:hypothetical protein